MRVRQINTAIHKLTSRKIKRTNIWRSITGIGMYIFALLGLRLAKINYWLEEGKEKWRNEKGSFIRLVKVYEKNPSSPLHYLQWCKNQIVEGKNMKEVDWRSIFCIPYMSWKFDFKGNIFVYLLIIYGILNLRLD